MQSQDWVLSPKSQYADRGILPVNSVWVCQIPESMT